MYDVTDDFISQISLGGKVKKVEIQIGEKTIVPQKFNPSFEGNLFKSVMQQIEFTVKNGEVLTSDTKINAKYGLRTSRNVKINGLLNSKLNTILGRKDVTENFEYINYIDYNIYSSELDLDTNEVTNLAYDNMVKFMKKYDKTQVNITYPTSMSLYVQAICNTVGVKLASIDFYNNKLTIDTDYYDGLDYTYRDILDEICKATCTTAIIKNGELLFKKPTQTNKIITTRELKRLTVLENFGGCNSLVLGRGDLNDNIYSRDETLIEQDGLQEIRFDNIELIDKRREQVIDGMFEQIKGLKYIAFETEDLGVGIFEPADICKFEDREGNQYETIVLNQSLVLTSGCSGNMSAEIPDTSTTNYEYASDSEKKQTRTEIIVNKQEQSIQGIISQIGDRSEKETSITADIDGLTSKVSQVTDYKREIEGTTQIHITDAGATEILELEIQGNKTYETNLFPSEDLYPSESLYPNTEVL